MCTTLIAVIVVGLLLSAIAVARVMLGIGAFLASWKPSWDGLFEKPTISYQENWDPAGWRFLSYLWERRYQSLPDDKVVSLAEKLRNSFFVAPAICLLTATIWLLQSELATIVCS